jgi:uncharacterized protein (TIGR03083 family)
MQAVIDQQAAQLALTKSAERVVDLIRPLSVSDTNVRIPGSDWTVGQASAHLVAVFRVFTDAVEKGEDRWLPFIPDVDDWRVRLSTTNERLIQDVQHGGESETVADQLAEAVQAFSRAIDGRSGDDFFGTPWYGRGVTRQLTTIKCLTVAELVLHGYDMAKALRQPWPLDPEHARLIVSGVFPAMIPLVAKPAAIKSIEASYDVGVTGGPRFVVAFDHGKVRVEPFSAQRVDCHIVSDPLAWLLVGYGRRSQWGPIARGKIRAWGRKPWLALKFKGLLYNP